MRILNKDQIAKLSIAIFRATGVPEKDSRLITSYLVEANLSGHDSHGIMKIPEYVKAIKAGRLKVHTDLKVIRETPSSAVVNGNGGIGQVLGTKCMKMAIKKAKEHSIGCVVAYNMGHLGRLSDYSIMAMKNGMIGITLFGSLGKSVAPFGGREGKLSTNPISVSIPAKEETPFLMDFATSIVAEGKIRDKLQRSLRVPSGYLIDKEGNPTNNPADLYEGGAILPLGGSQGYKGTALSVMAMLGGLLSGVPEEKGMMGSLFMAINIKDFVSVEEFKDRMDKIIRILKSSKSQKGFETVLTPGEPEIVTKKIRSKNGIEVPNMVWDDLVKTAEELELDIEKIF
jgi:uncharacterized oxidoreductase